MTAQNVGRVAGDRDSVAPQLTETAHQYLADLSQRERSKREIVRDEVLRAALSNIPWLGSILSARKAIEDGIADEALRSLLMQWLGDVEARLARFQRDIEWVVQRIAELGQGAMDYALRPEFLALVRKAFAAWERADTDQKRQYFCNLLCNHASSPLSDEDIATLYVEWVDRYHETHFRILSYVAMHNGCTKSDIGKTLFGPDLPPDASAKAGLFRELWRELSLGGLVRGERQIERGSFVRAERKKPSRPGTASRYVDTSFDDDDGLELSELGRDFVHYVMTGTAKEIDA